MSRIDKALRQWEGVAAEAPTDLREAASSPSTDRFNLSGYKTEDETEAGVPRPEPAVVAPATEIPSSSGTKPPGALGHPTRRAHANLDIDARLISGKSGAVPLEQYRRLAAVLHDIQLQQGLKTLMITSAMPSEGKTLTVVNLALTLSDSYARRVLIIDADLRWPSIHNVLGLTNGVGLSEALKGQELDLPIHQVTEHLAVLTAGRPGPAPLAGLTSARMAALIEDCAAQFDWVLIDTPPVGLLPDAQLLARLTRAVVFVIAAGSTPSAIVERAVAELGPDCIIGTVLNRVDDRRIPQADYYSYYSDEDRRKT